MSDQQASPILMTIPEQFESNRLVIRAPQWGDGTALNEAVIESIEELRLWLPFAQRIPTLEESEIVIREARLRYLDRSDLMLLVFHQETGKLIGSSGLHRIDWNARKFEIGYWLHSAYTNQGYMTEAVHAITHFAIEELAANRIEIRCDRNNARSAAVARRAGFTLEGILRNETTAMDGQLRDTMVFAKVRGVEF
ncbi:ribosomal-protein-serine acetyltransferase [Paenibacillus sp. CCS19]|uniref:GNAT family N-acetyltransferase n=1 Tax=Paenibacillus sp. CCS19 TaxID=3158387 RepID=UPI0025626FD0|nr:GNAT family N-acetyltransferase [Paenibacillus cellulosilyticus]GMK37237.1 ribosomal-protein-serine acetyltransferase [Paenibacillus cellulosilyticus]